MSITKQVPDINHATPWTCTDPDNFQYGRKLSPGVYQFKEWIGGGKLDEKVTETIEKEFNNPGNWEADTIVLANFNEQEIRGHVSAYYNSLEELKEIYSDKSNVVDWEWIVAECIFEQTSGLY